MSEAKPEWVNDEQWRIYCEYKQAVGNRLASATFFGCLTEYGEHVSAQLTADLAEAVAALEPFADPTPRAAERCQEAARIVEKHRGKA